MEFSYLCEIESEAERTMWTQNVADKLQIGSPSSRVSSSSSSSPTSVYVSQDSPDTRKAKRPLIRMRTSDLDAADDPFGLLSLTKSAFSSAASDAAGTDTNRTAPGLFSFNQIEIREEVERSEDDDAESPKSSNESTPRANAFHHQRTDRSTSIISAFSNGGAVGTPFGPPTSSAAAAASGATPSKKHCLRCNKRIGRLFRSAKVCSSCDNRFCREHCNQYTILTSLPKPKNSSTGKKLSLVCVDCLVRQKLLSSISELTSYYEAVVDVGGVSRLVRWKFFTQQPKLDLAKHVQCWELGPLSLLSAMFKYRQHPFMFVVVLAQLVKNVEYCVETMDFYWPQFLQWGFIHLADAPPSVQTHYLLFLAATSRRCVHLAVKATWECIAAHWDAMTSGAFDRGHFIIYMLFFATQVSFGEAHSVLHQLLFAAAPAHQLNELETLLTQLYKTTREVYVTSKHDSPYFSWLLARSEDEILMSSTNVRQQLFVNRDFLDPFPVDSDLIDQQQAALVARKSFSLDHLVDKKMNITNAPALHIFSDVIQLVRFLVDLTTFLKESTPVPSERKLKLPELLVEMLQGQHIRPEAYLPLVPVVSPLHRVVNVLTDEGTVFSTKARAPTLVYFEVIKSDISDVALRECFRKNTNPHTQSAVRYRQSMSSSIAKHSTQHGGDSPVRDGSITGDCGGLTRLGSHLDVLNFLDANIVETYVQDLEPRRHEEEPNSDSIFEDSDGLHVYKPTGAYSGSNEASAVSSSQHSAEDVDVIHVDAPEGEEEGDAENDRERWTTMAAERMMMDNTSRSESSSSSRVTGEPCRYFGERFEQMKERVRCESRFVKYPGWSLLPVIAKSFDDMRQEVFILQGLKICQLIFRKHNLNLWLRYYRYSLGLRSCCVVICFG